jgi:hypothetical protein
LAKSDLDHGEFETMVRDDLKMDPSTARRLMAIAEHPIISNRAHGHVLPPSWRTLYELTKLPDATLKAAIRDGLIGPEMERKDVVKLKPPPEEEVEPEDPPEPVAEEEDSEEEKEIGQQNLRSTLLMNAAMAVQCATYEYHGPVDAKLIKACEDAGKAWNDLALKLKGRTLH